MTLEKDSSLTFELKGGFKTTVQQTPIQIKRARLTVQLDGNEQPIAVNLDTELVPAEAQKLAALYAPIAQAVQVGEFCYDFQMADQHLAEYGQTLAESDSPFKLLGGSALLLEHYVYLGHRDKATF